MAETMRPHNCEVINCLFKKPVTITGPVLHGCWRGYYTECLCFFPADDTSFSAMTITMAGNHRFKIRSLQ